MPRSRLRSTQSCSRASLVAGGVGRDDVVDLHGGHAGGGQQAEQDQHHDGGRRVQVGLETTVTPAATRPHGCSRKPSDAAPQRRHAVDLGHPGRLLVGTVGRPLGDPPGHQSRTSPTTTLAMAPTGPGRCCVGGGWPPVTSSVADHDGGQQAIQAAMKAEPLRTAWSLPSTRMKPTTGQGLEGDGDAEEQELTHWRWPA